MSPRCGAFPTFSVRSLIMLVTTSNKKLHYLTMYCAAERPEINDRQCRRLIVRYREEVPLSLTHKRCSSHYNQKLRQGLAELALELIRTRYAEFESGLVCGFSVKTEPPAAQRHQP